MPTPLQIRKDIHASLNTLAMSHGAWLVSVPGSPVIRIEALPGSDVPGILRLAGYKPVKTGSASRLLPDQTFAQTDILEFVIS
jgi:hypothetical protein